MLKHRNASSPGTSRTPVKPEILSLLLLLRRRWMSTRHPLDKAEFNAATSLLRKALFDAKSDYFVDKLQAIEPNQNRGFAFWKCTRGLKRQPMRRFSLSRRDGTWARSDSDIAEEFANDLCERFTPFDLATDEEVLVTTTVSGVALVRLHTYPQSARPKRTSIASVVPSGEGDTDLEASESKAGNTTHLGAGGHTPRPEDTIYLSGVGGRRVAQRGGARGEEDEFSKETSRDEVWYEGCRHKVKTN
ncbi:hypothetical protein ACLKA6_019423 [Drosophila palustris]